MILSRNIFLALTYMEMSRVLWQILGLIHLNPLDTSASRHRLPTCNIRLPKPSRKYSMASISEFCCWNSCKLQWRFYQVPVYTGDQSCIISNLQNNFKSWKLGHDAEWPITSLALQYASPLPCMSCLKRLPRSKRHHLTLISCCCILKPIEPEV